MAEVNWELIILIIIVGLIVFAGLGIFVGTRISSDKRRIRELEEDLSRTKKELEQYRSKVNNHFQKTSELFSKMTSTYKAVYMHLAEGSQELCNDITLLKPVNSEFLKVIHEEEQADSAENIKEETADISSTGETITAEKTEVTPSAQQEDTDHPESDEPVNEEMVVEKEEEKEERFPETVEAEETAKNSPKTVLPEDAEEEEKKVEK